jgi:DNA helicase II / ATP-dependent DNA helicase PcrA
MAASQDIESRLLAKLTAPQKDAVKSEKRRLLVIAGAGSGKTEVMARRVAWWMAVHLVPKDEIVAFTFTERAAEEMKFRIRLWAEQIAKAGEDVTLGDMYIGTIHGFCLKKLRQCWPDEFHNYDVLDEGARLALVHRGYYGVLGLPHLQEALQKGMHATIEYFLQGYDLLNEYDELAVTLASQAPPYDHTEEPEWCKAADLVKPVGKSKSRRRFLSAPPDITPTCAPDAFSTSPPPNRSSRENLGPTKPSWRNFESRLRIS